MDAFSIPTTGPASRAPVRNPYLDEIDAAAQNAHAQLSPGAQKALQLAGAPMPQQAPAPQIQAPRPAPPTIRSPYYGKNTFDEKLPNGQDAMLAGTGISTPSTHPPTIAPVPQSPTQQTDTAELARITAPPPSDPSLVHTRQNTGTAGVNQIHNPWARIPLQILSGIGETFAPRLAAALPGTESHHQMLVGQREGALEQDQKQRVSEEQAGTAAATQQHLGAQTQEEMSQIPLHEAQTQDWLARPGAAADKLDAQRLKDQATQEHQQSQDEAKLRQLGYKRDEAGSIIPVSYEEMSPDMQAVHDLKAAQAEEAAATAELKKAQATNQPQVAQLQMARLQSAQVAHSIAAQRLGLSQQQFEMRAFGTNNGQPLPGSLITDEGQPVGTANAPNVRPTGQERNKADLASSAHEQLQDLKSIVQKRQDIFGPAAGRKTDFNVWLGSQDPDAQAFRAARTIAGDHLAGVFGGRSEAALSALDAAIGHFKDNPAAVIAGLDQLDKANNRFVQVGTPRTTGSNRIAGENVDPNVKAFADEFFSGDIKKAQAEIDRQKGKK